MISAAPLPQAEFRTPGYETDGSPPVSRAQGDLGSEYTHDTQGKYKSRQDAWLHVFSCTSTPQHSTGLLASYISLHHNFSCAGVPTSREIRPENTSATRPCPSAQHNMLAYYAFKKYKDKKDQRKAEEAEKKGQAGKDGQGDASPIPIGPDGQQVADPHGSPVEERDFHHGFATGYEDGVQHVQGDHQLQKA